MKVPLNEINFSEGSLLLLNKPYGITSFGLVMQVKKWTKAKVGHAGTLDPLASGLMICCTGKWTKKLGELTGKDKTYEGIIMLGASTPTYDLESLPENFKPTEHITSQEIEKVKEKFLGHIEQYPPAHSAIKQNGKAQYELAREGKEVKLAPRLKTIYSIDFDYSHLPALHFTVRCSSGTYIRSLAFDIGVSLECGAYLHTLRRTAIGEYPLSDAYSFEEMRDFFGSEMTLKRIVPKVK